MSRDALIRVSALRVALLATLAGLSTACVEWFADDVAMGVSRLTVRNVGAIATAIAADTTCGFASLKVRSNPKIELTADGRGRAIWQVSNCQLDFGGGTEIARDCNGIATLGHGRVRVTAEQVVVGLVTGNPESPVAPTTADAATVRIIEAVFEDFGASTSAGPEMLTAKSGSLSAVVAPRLAASTDGICSITTPNVHFSDIAYANAELHVRSASQSFDVAVESSKLGADNGRVDSRQNAIGGTISVWGESKTLAAITDGDGLDPTYDAAVFEAAYACTEGLALPVSFSCELEPVLAEGAARLTILTVGTLAKLASADQRCGLASPQALAAAVWTGTVGEPGGKVVTSAAGCELSFPEATAIGTDCGGVTTYVRGRAIITAKSTIAGVLTGKTEQPVVPTTREAATIEVEAELHDFVVWTSSAAGSLTFYAGTLSGAVTPRLGIDTSFGACAVPTPTARIERVSLSAASAALESSGCRFDLDIDGAGLEAASGSIGGHENYLAGTLGLGGQTYQVPRDLQGAVLDPSYDALTFEQSFTCDPRLALAQNDQACADALSKTLAQGAARLLIRSAGLVVFASDIDTQCGFASPSGMVPAEMTERADGQVTMRWSLDACRVGTGAPLRLSRDCIGSEKYIDGYATLNAVKNVTGMLTVGDPPVAPKTRDAVSYELAAVSFSDFAAYELLDGETAPAAELRIRSGTLSGTVIPITGEARENPGAFYIVTPLADFEGIRASNIDAMLTAFGMTFHVRIDAADLDAFNGSYAGVSNAIAGDLVLSGKRLTVPVDPNDPVLDPAFDQAQFDRSYACDPLLLATVPASGL